MTTIQELYDQLEILASSRIRTFVASLIPGNEPILGVRIPQLRRLAQQLARNDWQTWFLGLQKQAKTMEERLIQGMLPGYAPQAPLQDRLGALRDFIPSITNWCICDTCCCTYTFTRKHREEVWEFLQPILHSPEEFPARFGTVMLLDHYVKDPAWAPLVAKQLPLIPATGFYAEMAIGWCLCELHIQAPNLSIPLLQEATSPLRPSVLAIARRKIRESRRCP